MASKTVRSRAAAIVVATSLVGASGAPKDVASPLPPQATSPSAVTDLAIATVSPAEGRPIREGNTLTADLTYTIADFQPGAFMVFVQFETDDPNQPMTDGDFPGPYTKLTASTGRVQLKFPMKHIWRTLEAKRPFVVWFYLSKNTGGRTRSVVAKAGPVHLQPQE